MAACSAYGPSAPGETDWVRIAALYDALSQLARAAALTGNERERELLLVRARDSGA